MFVKDIFSILTKKCRCCVACCRSVCCWCVDTPSECWSGPGSGTAQRQLPATILQVRHEIARANCCFQTACRLLFFLAGTFLCYWRKMLPCSKRDVALLCCQHIYADTTALWLVLPHCPQGPLCLPSSRAAPVHGRGSNQREGGISRCE